jgi:hypothetical protein
MSWIIQLILSKSPSTPQCHPSSIWRRWKAATAEPKEQKVSHQQKQRDELIRLQEDNNRMRRDIERGGGDLWTSDDRPRDIARVMINKLGKFKAGKLADEIRKALKGAAS